MLGSFWHKHDGLVMVGARMGVCGRVCGHVSVCMCIVFV